MKLAITSVLMLALLGCAGDPSGGRVLNVAALDTAAAPTIEVSAGTLAAAPRLELATAPDLELHLGRDASEPDRRISSAALLGDGTIAVVTYRTSVPGTVLGLYHADGTSAGAPHYFERGHSSRLVVAPGDTIILEAYQERERSPLVRFDGSGKVVDTVFFTGPPVGVLRDGSFVGRFGAFDTRHYTGTEYISSPIHYYLLGRERFHERPMLWRRLRQSLNTQLFGMYTDERTRLLFIGAIEQYGERTLLGSMRPWLRGTAAAVSGYHLWVLPTGAPELVEIGGDGRVVKRIRWDQGELRADSAALHVWLEQELARSARSTVMMAEQKEADAAMLRRFSPGARSVRAGDVLRAGTDGSLWVRRLEFPVPWLDSARWIGFDTDGTVIGELSIARGFSIPYEFSRSHVLVQAPADTTSGNGPAVRRYRLVEKRAADDR